MTQLATAGELNQHLQRDIDPAVADQALTLATGAVIAYCGWGLVREAVTLYAEGSGTTVLTLPTMCLVAVDEVRIDGTAIDLDPTAVSWTRKGQLFRPAGWPLFSVIEVDGTHGYDPLPDVLKLITLELAARTINNPQGLISASTGQVSRTWANPSQPRLSTLDERLLDKYTLM